MEVKMNNTPTNELRYVKRIVPAPEYGADAGKCVQVLQQKWATYWSDDMGGTGGSREREVGCLAHWQGTG